MDGFSIRYSEEGKQQIDQEADELGISRSEYVRNILDSRNESNEDTEYKESYEEMQRKYAKLELEHDKLLEKYEDLEDEYEYVENERDRMERKLTAALELDDRNTELETYVEEEKSYRRAPLTKRIKYWVYGMGDE